ncbi:MAG: glycosyltransferase family 9 protein [Deltaproteobacteria bacterium]|nr:glycosyltransferase family 9 protein [Deltaproteobacteria bacterium]
MLVKGNNLPLNGIKKILLIQLGDIGDVVLTTPTIRALKENNPSGEIFVLLRSFAMELLEGCPWVDGVIALNKNNGKFREKMAYQKDFLSDLRRKRFELAIDLRAGTRGAFLSYISGARLRVGRYRGDGKLWRNRLFTHLIKPENELQQYSALHSLNILAPFKLKIKNTFPELNVTKQREIGAENILRKEQVPSDKPMIALHPFSRWRYKEWSIKNYIKLINYIGLKYRVSILITGSIDEKGRAAEIVKGSNIHVYNLAGKTSLGELVAILKKCSLLIGIDSASMHIAAAVGTPTVTIFGPSSPVNWAPRGRQHKIITKDFPCVPCRQKGCNNSEVSRCLDALSVEEIIPVVENKVLEITTSINL